MRFLDKEDFAIGPNLITTSIFILVSMLIGLIVLMTIDYEGSGYVQTLLKIVKKEKRKDILFFTCDADITMPQLFKQSVPVLLKDCDTAAKTMEEVIFDRLTRF